MIIGAEFEIGDRLGLIAQQGEKFMEIFGRGIVRTGCADDVQPFEAQLGLQRAQRMDLAGDADDGDAFVPGSAGGFEQGEQRRIAHAHAAHLRHAFGAGDDDRHGLPLIRRVGRHGQHGIDSAGFKQFLADAAGDPGPLRAGDGGLQ